MVAITIDNYIRVQAEAGCVDDEAKERAILQLYVLAKLIGAKCHVCDQPIWAVGSAAIDDAMCFTCITGEADSSDDYEIFEVCWT